VASFIRRLQPFRYLHGCSGCFRLERLAGWGFHPLENAALSRRTLNADSTELVDHAIAKIAGSLLQTAAKAIVPLHSARR
jgi:hypothetical protein